MAGLNAAISPSPVTYAILSTTRDWVDADTLRNGWKDMARRVRSEVAPGAGYMWFREFTQRDETVDWRRTHYHSTWNRIENDDQAAAVAEISNEVWGRLAGAWSEHAHGHKRIWDAGGLTRYVAGLAGHHLKSGQTPPPNWSGRRVGTSRGFYAIDARELRSQAVDVVRDERLRHRLEVELLESIEGPGSLPEWIADEVLTDRLVAARAAPKPRVVRLPRGWEW